MAKFTSKTQSKDAAVYASSAGEAVRAESTGGHSTIVGSNKGTGAGIHGENVGDGVGGLFKSDKKEGIVASTVAIDRPGILCRQDNPNSNEPALKAEHIDGGRLAGFFKGNVTVTGDLSFPGADFSEDFTVDETAVAEPGTVMALSAHGTLVPCADPYEKKVVGVVAGAGSFRTGIVMDRQSEGARGRQPIALVGKVFCKVDARYGAIEVGDLLTSSATHGHAMKASDPARAFGAVIGKAMAPFHDGVGLIPILIALQ